MGLLDTLLNKEKKLLERARKELSRVDSLDKSGRRSEAAAELELPVLGAALPGADGRESEHFLTRLGAEIVTLDGDVIAARTRSLAPRFAGALDAASLIETLQLMRHSIR